MGVQGLMSVVLNQNNKLGKHISVDGKKILIDASSFLHWVIGRLGKRKKGNEQTSALEHVVEGMIMNLSPVALHKELMTLLNALRARNVHVEFITDNLLELDDNGLKAETKAKRYRKRLKDYERWLRGVLNMPVVEESDEENEELSSDDDEQDHFDHESEPNEESDEEKLAEEPLITAATEADEANDESPASDEASDQPTSPLVSNARVMYPAAAARVLKAVCKLLGIRVSNAQGEADWFLARKCIRGKFDAVVGQDSDFFVFRNCKCICDFHSLFFNKTVPLYTQSAVAKYFGFSKDQYEWFLDFVLLAGNDYTSQYVNVVKRSLQELYANDIARSESESPQQPFAEGSTNAMLIKLAWQRPPPCDTASTGVLRCIDALELENPAIRAAWETARDLYCLEADYSELVPELQVSPEESAERVCQLQAVVAKAHDGVLSRHTARAICGHRFIGHPVVDPFSMYDMQIGVHGRCTVLRRAMYDVLGIAEICETMWRIGDTSIPSTAESISIILDEDDDNAWTRLTAEDQNDTSDLARRTLHALCQALCHQLGISELVTAQLSAAFSKAKRKMVKALPKRLSQHLPYILPAFFYAWTWMSGLVSTAILPSDMHVERWVHAFLAAMLHTIHAENRNDNTMTLRNHLEAIAGRFPMNLFEEAEPAVNVAMVVWSEIVAFNEMVDLLHVVRGEATHTSFCVTDFTYHLSRYLTQPDRVHDTANTLINLVKAGMEEDGQLIA